MKKKLIVKKAIQKEKKETTPQHFCVAEDCMLLEGGCSVWFYGLGSMAKTLHSCKSKDKSRVPAPCMGPVHRTDIRYSGFGLVSDMSTGL